MAREFSRSRRVAEQIQRELAQLIQMELRDPRIGMVTVTSVELSKDLTSAKVFVTVLGQEDHELSLRVLNGSIGFLRTELGHRMRMRVVPDLRFIYDESIERASRLSALIEKANPKQEDNQ